MKKANLKESWELAINLIIRPERSEYDISDLGPSNFSRGGYSFERVDLELENARGLTLQCSWYRRVDLSEAPCVIYLHGNCGSRLAADTCLQTLLPFGVSVFTFDFSGSGLSQGEYVSLGAHEKNDLAAVVQHLRASGKVTTIGLWGVSMGAVTAILFAQTDPSIAAMVLDSPFSKLSDLVEELVAQHEARIPKPLVKVALGACRKGIQKRADFDINDLAPVDVAPQTFIPALFVHGEQDNFVRPHHSERIHECYAGDKNRILVTGDHNSRRPAFLRDSISIFFAQTMQLELKEEPPHQQHSVANEFVEDFGGFGANQVSLMTEEEEMIARAIALSLQDQEK